MKVARALVAAVLGLCMVGGMALADSISPSSFSADLSVGESVTIQKTVTVSAGPPTSSKVDVFFLADTTGSMGPYNAAIEAASASILAQASLLGDVAFGVGEYKDFGDSFAYRQNTDITTDLPTAQAGINLWGASGGGDYPEANLFALEQVANTTTWRAGSERVLVWFGDAPGHDPSGGVTEAAATAALISNNIQVEAINVGTGDGYAPYGVGHRGLNDTDQASRIAAATGGDFLDGIDASTIVDAIRDAIEVAVATYSTVGLDISAVPLGVSVAVVPGSYVGDYDRSIERMFTFDVTFTGDAAGTYGFPIYATVDGGRVAIERDRIVVGTSVPDGGSTVALLGLATAGLAMIRRIFA